MESTMSNDSTWASIFNRLAVDSLSKGEDKISVAAHQFLVERLRELDWDLRVKSSSVKKTADEITLSFQLGTGHEYKEYTKQWTELELLDQSELLSNLVGDVLVAAVKDYRSQLGSS